MPKYKATVKGLDAVKKELQKLGTEMVQAAKRGLEYAADGADNRATKNVHKDTGAAAANIEVRYENDGLTAKVGWFKPEFYYMIWQELGTKNRKAHPALTNAGRKAQKEFLEAVEREVKGVTD